LPPRFFVVDEPAGCAQFRSAQDELAGERRRRGRDQHGHDERRRSRSHASDARPREQRQPDAGSAHHHADAGFDRDVPRTRQEERGQEVTVEPALIRGDRADDQRRGNGRDGELSDDAR